MKVWEKVLALLTDDWRFAGLTELLLLSIFDGGMNATVSFSRFPVLSFSIFFNLHFF